MNKMRSFFDSEQKRNIIGNEVIQVFEDEARKLGEIDFLVQVTLYSDVVESGTNKEKTIKAHRNVGGLSEDMQFKMIELL